MEMEMEMENSLRQTINEYYEQVHRKKKQEMGNSI